VLSALAAIAALLSLIVDPSKQVYLKKGEAAPAP
jgi:hypothetical protein